MSRERDDRWTAIFPDDAFWELSPGASGESDVSKTLDTVLYDD